MTGLIGTGTLIRFILRRDRIRLTVWIVAVAGGVIGSAASYPTTYPTAADMQTRAELMDNPIMRALSGPGYGLDDYTYGAAISNELMSFTIVVVAIMSILLIVRHTRAEEETGRAELIRATVVGHHAAATASMVVVGAVNLVIGAALAFGLYGSVEGVPLDGSLLFGAAVAICGILFAGVALVTAQINEHARGATGLGLAVAGAAFVVRGIGDMGNGVLSWLSPIGWSQATEAYVNDRWWPLALSLVATVALIAAALVLSTRRDVGLGMMSARPGRPEASSALASSFALSVRLQRGILMAWGVGVVLLGLTYGTMGGEVETFIADNPTLADFLAPEEGVSFTDQWFSVIMVFLGLLSAAAATQAALRVRTEETTGRIEPLLATPLHRSRWLGGHLMVAMVGGAIVLLMGGAGIGITGAISLGDAAVLPEMIGAAAVYLPAMWLLIGVAVALFGLFPRAVALVWVVVSYGLVIGMLGGYIDFPDWVVQLSPFEHVPGLPAADFAIAPMLILTAIAVVLAVAGFAGWRRRDLQTVG